MKTRVLLAAICLIASTAHSQADSTLNGDWVARFPSLTGNPAQVNLKIVDSTGTWQSMARNPNNPCLGRKYPVSVAVTGPDTVTLTVTGSQALAGCDDFKLELKRLSATALEGQFPDGRKVSVTR
jgi:hypothetical protein